MLIRIFYPVFSFLTQDVKAKAVVRMFHQASM